MPEPPLQPLPSGDLKIHAEHFRKVVRRIEDIKPLAGPGISITPKEGGIEISSSGTGSGGGLGGCPNLKILTLDVCRNGEPDQIYVLGFETDGAAEICADLFAS